MLHQPTYQFKVVLVGDSSVGKSSILARFVDDQFSETLLSTIGVDFKFKRINVNQEQIKLQIWDTAGQENFRALTSAYYHSADAILIVYDITSSDSFDVNQFFSQNVLDYWVKQSENNNKNDALIFSVGNKLDNESNRCLDAQKVQKFIQDHNISKNFEVSAKTGVNVEQTFIEVSKILISKGKGAKHIQDNKQSENKKQKTSKKEKGEKKLSKSAPIVKLAESPQTEEQGKKCCRS